jgi:hypothetical protein
MLEAVESVGEEDLNASLALRHYTNCVMPGGILGGEGRVPSANTYYTIA